MRHVIRNRATGPATWLFVLAALGGAGWNSAEAHSADVHLELVALSGQFISDEPDAPRFGNLQRRPAVNAHGHVSFSSRFLGPGEGAFLWRRDQGVTPLIVSGDDPPDAPQLGPVSVEEDITPWLSDFGDVGTGGSVFVVTDTDYDFVDTHWAAGPGEPLVTIAQVGVPLGPPLEGTTIWDLSEVGGVDRDGSFYFAGRFRRDHDEGGFTTGDAMWVTKPGEAAEVILASGFAAPGFPTGQTVRSLGESFALDESGEIAFIGSVGETRTAALWFDDRDGPELLLREGDPTPGFREGTIDALDVADDFPNIAMNRRGNVAARGRTSAGVEMIWGQDARGAFTTSVAVGDEAPGLPGSTFEYLVNFTLDDRERLTFSALAREPRTGGVWSAGKGRVWPRLLPGDPVKSRDRGLEVEEVGYQALVNSRGAFIVDATIGGDGRDSRRALLLVRHKRKAELLLEAGRSIELPPPYDAGVIEDFEYQVSTCAGNRNFNANGEIALVLEFVSGQRGIYLLTIPEARKKR